MIDDPLSLLSLGIWLMAAGMWPVGFLFGACSACCDEGPCVCGNRDAVDGTQARDEADWCCSGDLPPEITVRVSNSVVGATDPDNSSFGDVITPKCEDVEGDYVLELTSRFGASCVYLYVPSACEFECPELGDDEPALPLFVPGIGIAAYAGRPNLGSGRRVATQFVSGPGFEFGVTIFTGSLAQNPHCAFTFGMPAEVEATTGSPNAFSGATNGPEPILIFGSVATNGVLFEGSQCDIRGLFSGQAIGDPGYPFSFPEARGWDGVTANASHRFLHAGIQSLDACDSLVSGSFSIGGFFDPGTFVEIPENTYAIFDSHGCAFDVEILAP
jgi:hypothetical protein